jgi:hypothetical protein
MRSRRGVACRSSRSTSVRISWSRAVVVVAVAVATIAAARPARASDKMETTLDLSLHGESGVLDTGGVTLGPKGRAGYTLHGFRFGAGVGLLRFASFDAWGFPTELFAGYALGDAEGLRVYADLRASATHVFPSSQEGAPQPANRWLLGLGPRLGLRGPIGEYFFFDLSVAAGVGPERFGVSWGIGVPIPTSNL